MSSAVASSVAAPPNVWEERLAREAANARAVDFEADRAAGRDPVIRASFLRDLLLGFITLVDPSGKPEPIRLPIGLKARGFRIVDEAGGPGTLDLNDAQGRHGPALPPIRLEAVSFARLQTRHARLGRLELLDCRFTSVDVEGAAIDGDVDLSGARALVGGGECTVSARSARVDGGFTMARARLRLTARKPVPAGVSTRYALDLTSSEVIGTIDLRPTFVADGGVRISDSRVHGDVWIDGGVLKAGEAHALNAQSARITGSLFFRCLDREGDTIRFEATGTVWLSGAEIGGGLECGGARLDGGKGQVLNAQNAKIAGTVLLRAWDGTLDGEKGTVRFEATGTVWLLGAEIGGNLACDAARLDGGEGQALDAQGTKIDGVVLLRAWDGTPDGEKGTVRFEAMGHIDFLGARIEGQMELRDLDLVTRLPGLAFLNLVEASIQSALRVRSIRALLAEGPPPRPTSSPLASVDLSRARVGTLDDGAGRAWGDRIALILDGFTFDHVADQVDDGSSRKAWLKRQYENGTPTKETYRAQPHEYLAMVLDKQGANDAAREILADKLGIEARLSAWWQKPLWFIYWAMARYGLSGVRAMCTMATYVVLGVILVKCAIAADMLVAERRPGSTEVTPPCGSNISTLVFAVDLALPVMKLGEEGRCAVRDADPKQLYRLISIPTPLTSDPNALIRWWSLDLMKATVWRLLFATYAILGWIVTSITVLTLTGVLRRAAER